MKAVDFFKKYHLDQADNHLDQNLMQDGLQSSWTMRDIVHDFKALDSAQEKYRVFIKLQKSGDREVLKQITHFHPRSIFSSNNWSPFTNELTRLKIQLSKNPDVWDARLYIAETTFNLSELFYAYQASLPLFTQSNFFFTGFKELYDIKAYVKYKMLEIYDPQWTENGHQAQANTWFDSDGDFDPDVINSESAFDDQDIAPMDPVSREDANHDGWPDIQGYQSQYSPWAELRIQMATSGKATIYMGPHGSMELPLTITRDGDHYELNLEIIVGVTKEDQNLTSYLTEEKLNELSEKINAYFNDLLQNRKDISFKVHLVNQQQATPRGLDSVISGLHTSTLPDIYITNQTQRSISKAWTLDLLNKPSGMAHEVAHLLGFDDYYDEPLIAAGHRDHTLAPGLTLLSQNSLMADHNKPGARLSIEELLTQILHHQVQENKDQAEITEEVYSGKAKTFSKIRTQIIGGSLEEAEKYIHTPDDSISKKERCHQVIKAIILTNNHNYDKPLENILVQDYFPLLNLNNPEDRANYLDSFKNINDRNFKATYYEKYLPYDPLNLTVITELFFHAVLQGYPKKINAIFDRLYQSYDRVQDTLLIDQDSFINLFSRKAQFYFKPDEKEKLTTALAHIKPKKYSQNFLKALQQGLNQKN